MTIQTHTSVIHGIDAFAVTIQTHPSADFEIEGLPPASEKEARVRLKAALASIPGVDAPRARVELSSAAPLRGACADLAIGVGLGVQAGVCRPLDPSLLGSTLLLGGLSLAGEIRPVRGVVSALLGAAARGLTHAIIPAGNAAEVEALGPIYLSKLGKLELDVRCARTLEEALAHLNGGEELPKPLRRVSPLGPVPASLSVDLADIRGQAAGKRALEIAATGAHNVLFIGPPGAGKTMLARRLAGILPPRDPSDPTFAQIASAAGLGPSSWPWRPFRAPHHTASSAAIVGGGDPIRPGEVTLAHGGVLFLDELPEFPRASIDALGRALDEGIATVVRSGIRVAMPAAPIVVGAMNPCPCGWHGDVKRACSCSPARVKAYRDRIRGPFLAHFDLIVQLPPVRMDEIIGEAPASETSATVQARAWTARERLELDPFRGEPEGLGTMRGLTSEARRVLSQASDRRGLTGREVQTTIRVARTCAALEVGSEGVQAWHVAEALALRGGLS